MARLALNNGRRVIIAIRRRHGAQQQRAESSRGLAGYLPLKAPTSNTCGCPTRRKVGLDDYLVGHTVEELMRLVKPTQPPVRVTTKPAEPPVVARRNQVVKPVTLDEVHKGYRPRSATNTTSMRSI